MNISVQKAPVFVSLAVAGMLALSGCVSVNSSGRRLILLPLHQLLRLRQLLLVLMCRLVLMGM